MQLKSFSLLNKYPLPDSWSISWLKNNSGCLKKRLFFIRNTDSKKKVDFLILLGNSVFPTGVSWLPDCHWTHWKCQNLFSLPFLHSCVCFQHTHTFFLFKKMFFHTQKSNCLPYPPIFVKFQRTLFFRRFRVSFYWLESKGFDWFSFSWTLREIKWPIEISNTINSYPTIIINFV